MLRPPFILARPQPTRHREASDLFDTANCCFKAPPWNANTGQERSVGKARFVCRRPPLLGVLRRQLDQAKCALRTLRQFA
jgi:hypothetical protein